jgi:hypothetical protein
VLASAVAAGAEVVRCEGEADQDLAIACARAHGELGAGGEAGHAAATPATAEDEGGGCAGAAASPAFVLGLDSDFHLFSGCRYIRFDQLQLGGSVALAIVWTRAALAEMTGLSQSQLVEWAILIGNDYTGHFAPRVFGEGAAAALNAERCNLVEAAREYLIATECVQLQSEVEPVRRAMQLSRALYACEDLAAFPPDESSEVEEQEERGQGPTDADMDTQSGIGQVRLQCHSFKCEIPLSARCCHACVNMRERRWRSDSSRWQVRWLRVSVEPWR